MDRREWRLILLLGASVVFNRYGTSLLGFSLVQIQDELGLAESQLGVVGSIVELGTLPAIALLFLADRIGRRRILIATIIGGSVLNSATAFVGHVESLVFFQVLSRIFFSAQFGLAVVIAVEELSPRRRGFGVGVLGTFAVAGHGLAMIGLGVINLVPGGWRGLFACSALAVFVVLPLWTRLQETRSFEELVPKPEGMLSPIRRLVRMYPRRCAAVVIVTFLWSFSNQPVDFFLAKFAQDAHGLSPERFATMAVLGGILGLSGQLVAGWISDRSGRRPAMLVAFILEPCAAIALYSATAALLPPIYVAWIFASVANDVLGRTTSAELFPTSVRATSAGIVAVVGSIGAALGLACESVLFGIVGSHWDAVRLVAIVGLAIAPIVWLVYPETSGRELEEISPEGM